MENLRQEKRQEAGKEGRESINVILSLFNTKEALRYWINVLVKEGKLSKGRAGQILIEQGLY